MFRISLKNMKFLVLKKKTSNIKFLIVKLQIWSVSTKSLFFENVYFSFRKSTFQKNLFQKNIFIYYIMKNFKIIIVFIEILLVKNYVK